MPKSKRMWALWLVVGGFLTLLSSCGTTKLTLSRAHMSPKGMVASPALLPLGADRSMWETQIKPDIAFKLQDQVFGFLPDSSATRIVDRKTLAASAFNNTARVEEYTLIATATFADTINESPPFKMVVLTPLDVKGPVPVILLESFCPNHNTVPLESVSRDPDGFDCGGGGLMNGVMKFVFGRYIATPPNEMIVKRGYALAAIFPSEYAPDRAQSALPALKMLSGGHQDDETRWGTVAAWSWGFSRMLDVLETDTRYDANAFVTYGHSRYGKAALVAAAYDPRISGVISHQSGTGGASLNKQKKGETVKDITKGYPHWFSKKYASYIGHEDDMSIDQHGLLALIAPRPIFLGNARRDVWSDPNGAFRAAQGANSVYKLYNKQGLEQDKLRQFIPSANISFYIRPGTHGVVKEDWPVFLDFMDAHFK